MSSLEDTPAARDTSTLPWYRQPAMLRLVALCAVLPLLGGLAGLLLAATSTERYTAHAYVFISGTGADAAVSPSEIAQATARVATTESVLISGGGSEVLLAASVEEDLTASSSPDAPLIDLAATAGTAQQAADLANELAGTVTRSLSTVTSQLTMESRVFATAAPPVRPSSPNLLVNVVAGAALGAFLAVVAVVLRRPREEAGR